MTILWPQADLPLVARGGADLWDTEAGAILHDEFFVPIPPIELAGNAQVQASSIADLSISVRGPAAQLEGAVLSVSSAESTLSTLIRITGNAVSVVSSGGGLAVQIRLDGAAIAHAASAAGLFTQIELGAQVLAQSSAAGSLSSAAAQLASNALDTASVVATLTTSIRLNGQLFASAKAGSLLTTAIPLTALALAQLTVTGELSFPIELACTAVAESRVFGDLQLEEGVRYQIRASVEPLASLTPDHKSVRPLRSTDCPATQLRHKHDRVSALVSEVNRA